jgi:DNA repair exonuclease SbcCD nuclease subunit
MSKIAIIADTHYGTRNDNQLFYEYFAKFSSEVLFPYIDKHNIKSIVHLGDVVDRRKYINYLTARRLDRDLMKPMFDRGMNVHVIIGNHDVAYKDTNEINSMQELYGDSKHDLHIHSRPTEVEIEGIKVAMMPWICQDTYDDSIEILAKSTAHVMMGHLDLNGFEEYKGHISENRMDSNLFQRFDVVLSGHFHHRSSYGNIHYIGATAQHTWSDYDDLRGFAVFDTETRELEYVDNPFEIFKKHVYDDQGASHTDVLEDIEASAHKYKGTYTKVIVKNKTNPWLFDQVITKIQEAGVHDLQIVEDHLNLDVIDDEDLIDEAQDTMTILKKYIGSLDIKVSKKKVEQFMQELYNEALTIE